jgi:hypothetical protein
MKLDRERKNRKGQIAWAAALILPMLAVAGGAGAQRPPVATTPFERVWQRADLPVAEKQAERSWTWGPTARETRFETLVEGKGGMRQVQYWDKSRMEINNPDADPNSQWYVSNGLLVVEMISGKLQLGANTFEQREPANIPVAGNVITMDPGKPGATTPTYASLAGVASLEPGQNVAQPRIGQEVVQVLGPDGRTTGQTPDRAQNAPRIKYYDPTTRHNVPDVFYDYMNSSGIVYEGGRFVRGQVFNWIYAIGYPITEPYWITVEINGQQMQVMIQAFQRRLLTYNPANAPQWRVEMGNVGLQYYQWRYGQLAKPNPTPQPGGTPMTTRRVAGSNNEARGQSAIEGELYTVVNSQQAWADLWRKHMSNVDPQPPVPNVDFSREFVVGAWWGEKPDGCYRLDIEGVTRTGDTIQVRVNARKVGSACIQVITYPHDLQAVSKSGLTSGNFRVVFVDQNGKTLGEQRTTLP